MRLLDILAAPGCAGSRATRWTALGAFILFAIGALVFGAAVPGAKGGFVALVIYGFGLACLWILWLSALLLVARDGRHLRLPRVVADTAAAAGVYAAACVAAPVIHALATGGDAGLAALLPALTIAGSLAFVLLPRWLAVWLTFIPALYVGLHNGFGVPSPLDPRFQHWAWLALAVLVLVDAIRWRQLLGREDNDDTGWNSVMLLQFRQNVVARDWGLDRQWDWRRPAGARTDVDFRAVGPARPIRAIQVALGGWYVPQTWRGRLGTLARVVLPVLLVIPLLMFMNIGHDHSRQDIWESAGTGAALGVALVSIAMLSLAVVAIARRRWSSAAGMAALALLPGLGDNPAGAVLRAVLRGPAIGFAAMWLTAMAVLVLVYPHPMAALMATLFIAAVAALTFTAVLKALMGRPLGMFAAVTLGVVLLVLTNASYILVLTSTAEWGMRPVVQGVTVLAWLGLMAWTAWQAARAWRSLWGRPHPFLANPPR